MVTKDLFMGLIILFLVGWFSFIQLNQTNLKNTVGAIGIQHVQDTILFSPEEICKQKEGMVLVHESELAGEEYTMTAQTIEKQRILCFYSRAEN
jgi:hypothetical protein